MLTDEQRARIVVLTHKMSALGLSVKPMDEVTVGPVVSVYRFVPQGSTKISNVEALAQDFAAVLAVEDVVVKRVPGDIAVSLFVPNRERKFVKWLDVCTIPPNGGRPKIPLLMGIDHLGKRVLDDLTTFPHLLVAGSTGGGKSTWLNAELATLMLNYSPNEVRLALCDLKEGIEFQHFRGAPHLMYEIATSNEAAHQMLDDLIGLMENRLKMLASAGVRNIDDYNLKSGTPLSYICFCIDEFADLLRDKRKPFAEGPSSRSRENLGQIAQRKLCSLAAKARASGIHIIAATQRPSVKLVEGDIKANFLGRLTFRLPSEADSRVILGTSGAEHLLARGDMLYQNPNRSGVQRIHAPQASIQDIQAAIDYALRRQP